MKSNLKLLIAASVLATAGTAIVSGAGATTPTIKGLACAPQGITTAYHGKKFTCISEKIKVGGKFKTVLRWNAGVVIPTTTTTTVAGLPTTNFDTWAATQTPLWQSTYNDAAGALPSTFANDWTFVQGDTGVGTTNEIEDNIVGSVAEDGTGNLVITATCVVTSNPGCMSTNQPMGQTWTSGRIWTNGANNKTLFEYGMLEARIWMPSGSFNWPAFWMMGQNFNNPQVGWPTCGELDIAEGLHNNTVDQATVHSNQPGTSQDWGNGGGLTQTATQLSTASMTGGFHTYGIIWAPNSITYILDGHAWARDVYDPKTTDVTQTVGTAHFTVGPNQPVTNEGGNWPFNQPFFIILNNAIGGVASPVAPDGTTSKMKINWVRYYKYNGLGTVSH